MNKNPVSTSTLDIDHQAVLDGLTKLFEQSKGNPPSIFFSVLSKIIETERPQTKETNWAVEVDSSLPTYPPERLRNLLRKREENRKWCRENLSSEALEIAEAAQTLRQYGSPGVIVRRFSHMIEELITLLACGDPPATEAECLVIERYLRSRLFPRISKRVTQVTQAQGVLESRGYRLKPKNGKLQYRGSKPAVYVKQVLREIWRAKYPLAKTRLSEPQKAKVRQLLASLFLDATDEDFHSALSSIEREDYESRKRSKAAAKSSKRGADKL